MELADAMASPASGIGAPERMTGPATPGTRVRLYEQARMLEVRSGQRFIACRHGVT